MKKVIQVLGTVRSGTTYLSLLIASQHGSAVCLGEVYPLFKPLREDHVRKRNELELKDNRWKILLSLKPSLFYEKFFELFPDIDLIVDSSKEPIWYYLSSFGMKNYQLSRILVYKNPIDLDYSFSKRRSKASVLVFKNYHRKVFRILGNGFKSIRLGDLRSEADLLRMVKYLFDEQIEVSFELNKSHLDFNFFGSDTLFIDRSRRNEGAIVAHLDNDHPCYEIYSKLNSMNLVKSQADIDNHEKFRFNYWYLTFIYLKDFWLR